MMRGAVKRDLGRLLAYGGVGLVVFSALAFGLTGGDLLGCVSHAGTITDRVADFTLMPEPIMDAEGFSMAAPTWFAPHPDPMRGSEFAVLAVSFSFLFAFNLSLARHVTWAYTAATRS